MCCVLFFAQVCLFYALVVEQLHAGAGHGHVAGLEDVAPVGYLQRRVCVHRRADLLQRSAQAAAPSRPVQQGLNPLAPPDLSGPLPKRVFFCDRQRPLPVRLADGQQDAPRGNEPDSPNLPGEAEPLEEIEDDTDDADDAEAEAPAEDELAKATEIARQNDGITQALLEQQMGVTAEKAIALLDELETAGVIDFYDGRYYLAKEDSEEE